MLFVGDDWAEDHHDVEVERPMAAIHVPIVVLGHLHLDLDHDLPRAEFDRIFETLEGALQTMGLHAATSK